MNGGRAAGRPLRCEILPANFSPRRRCDDDFTPSQAATGGDLLEDVVASHRSGVRQTVFATSRDLDGLALHGEVDTTSTDVFQAVLAAASHSASRVLWLDLAEVAHLDAGACWGLDDATRAFRVAGGHVLLIAPQPPVELILQLMEVEELPGMHLLGARP